MMLVLLLHWTVLIFELDFPGYSFDDSTQMREEEDGNDTENGRCETTLTPCVLGFFKFKPKSSNSVSTRKYFILAIPATLDLVSFAVWMFHNCEVVSKHLLCNPFLMTRYFISCICNALSSLSESHLNALVNICLRLVLLLWNELSFLTFINSYFLFFTMQIIKAIQPRYWPKS